MRIQSKLTLSEQIKSQRMPKVLHEGDSDSACFKVITKPSVSWKDCAIYVKLRQNQCPKREALQYSQRKRCRIDISQQKLGPPQHRVLKLKESSITSSCKGWGNALLVEHDVKQPEIRPIEPNDFRVYQRIDFETKKMINQLNLHQEDKLIHEQQHTFNLKKLTKQQLLQKLRILNDSQDVVSELHGIADSPGKQYAVQSCKRSTLRTTDLSDQLSIGSSVHYRLKKMVSQNDLSAERSGFMTQTSENQENSCLSQLLMRRYQLRHRESKRIRFEF